MRHLTHRNYTQATRYEDSPEQIKNRELRNTARYEMESVGRVHKGDGNDVDHQKPVSKGGTNAKGNLDVRTEHNNRSFSRNPDNTLKTNKPKKR